MRCQHTLCASTEVRLGKESGCVLLSVDRAVMERCAAEKGASVTEMRDRRLLSLLYLCSVKKLS